jgi:hypothetical protein
MYMAVALLVWVAWIINPKYEVRSRRYENTFNTYLPIMSLPVIPEGIFFIRRPRVAGALGGKSFSGGGLLFNQYTGILYPKPLL